MSFRIELQGLLALAVCRCGWRSRTTSSAGIAGTFWDVHLEQVIGGAEPV